MGVTLLALALATQSSAVPAAPVEKPKLICRESEQETGTHIRSGRRCKTAEEWQREEDSARRAAPPSMRITEGQGDALTKQEPH